MIITASIIGIIAWMIALAAIAVWLVGTFASHACTRGGTEHRFEARYESRPRLATMDFNAAMVAMMHDDMIGKDRVYVRDVCTRCGKTVERQAPAAEKKVI